MIRSFLYDGDISPLFKNRLNGGRIYDDHAHMELSMANKFEEQLMGERKFRGNVKVDSRLFMTFPDGMSLLRRKEREEHFYRNSPTIAGMMRALEFVCANLLFDKDAVIVAMSMEKRWSLYPRLEMIISELGIHEKRQYEWSTEEVESKKGASE